MSNLNIFKKFVVPYKTERGMQKWKVEFPDGKGFQCRKQGFLSQEIALEWIAIEHERTRLGYVKTRQSFCDFTESFLLNEKHVKPATRISYEAVLRLYMKPFFKEILLPDLNVQVASGFLKSLNCDRDISGTHKRKIFSTFKLSYREALTSGFALDARVLNLPLPKKDTQESKCWTTEEMWRFINSSELRLDQRFYLWVIAAMVGGRAGEFMALEWGDVDLDSVTPSVYFSKRRCQKSGEVFQGTKNGDNRVVHLIPDAALLLNELKAKSLPAFPLKKVFDQSFDQKHFARDLKRACHRVGVTEITFHQLRHSFLTWLSSSGVDSKLISMMAGHRDERITAIYIHRTQEMQSLFWDRNKGKVGKGSLIQDSNNNPKLGSNGG
jgi:integrase